MNHSIVTADRNTHIRVVAVSLLCTTAFVAAMLAGRVETSEPQLARAEAPLIVKVAPTQLGGQQPTIR
jgi:hypothetical protein